jgi:aspartyl-tRNA(Asn)/glutamyl-tRNA(Gln) amidotransferase subunit A
MNADDLRRLSLIGVRDALARGEVSSEDVTLAAIEQADRHKDAYNLFVTYTPERALADARAADAARAAGRPLGPLHGVPITIKDNIDVAGVRTTCGSRVFAERMPTADATVVARLKDAGAIVTLGQTNLHEMAMGGTSTNPHYGAVHNPWDFDRVPGGSTGGGAACLSLGIGYAAMGTDFGGSVRMPVSFCGLVGLKQTHGVVSLQGIFASSNWNFDHIGPLTRDVADCRLMLEVLAGYDPADPESSPRPIDPAPPALNLRGLRVGLATNYFWEDLDAEVEARCRAAVDRLVAAGAVVVPQTIPHMDLFAAIRAASGVDGWVLHEPYIIAHPDWYGEDIRYRLLTSQFVTAADYAKAQRARRLVMQALADAAADVDVMAMPTLPEPAPLIKPPEAGGSITMGRNTHPFNLCGLPAVSVPVGLTAGGLPVGLQLVSSPFQDYKLLSIAGAVEGAAAFDPIPPVARG